jgi:hypothetical protein
LIAEAVVHRDEQMPLRLVAPFHHFQRLAKTEGKILGANQHGLAFGIAQGLDGPDRERRAGIIDRGDPADINFHGLAGAGLLHQVFQGGTNRGRQFRGYAKEHDTCRCRCDRGRRCFAPGWWRFFEMLGVG